MKGMSAGEFNRRFPVGTPVIYRPIIGGQEQHRTRTRSLAWTLGHGATVVAVDGFIGGMAIEAIEVVDDADRESGARS